MFTELTPIEYLKCDIMANLKGSFDKLDWDERIGAFDMLSSEGLETMVDQAENPALFFAGVQAYRDAVAGKPSGYPVSLDATASGLQILSALSGCEKSASLCNIVPTGHREDAYTVIYKVMCDAIDDVAKISRSDCKQAIMTSLYSSVAIPKQVFGEGKLLDTFFETMDLMAPGAWELNKALQGLWNPEALSHDWVLPDNFHAKVKVMDKEQHFVQFLNAPIAVDITVNMATEEGRSLSPNITHSIDGMIVREMLRRCMFNPKKIVKIIRALNSPGTSKHSADDQMVITLWQRYEDSGFLSARILDHLTVENMGWVDPMTIGKLIKSLPDVPFELLTIHDCFRVLPNYATDLRRQYNQIMSEIAASHMLQDIATQLRGTFTPVTKVGDISALVLEADYSLS